MYPYKIFRKRLRIYPSLQIQDLCFKRKCWWNWLEPDDDLLPWTVEHWFPYLCSPFHVLSPTFPPPVFYLFIKYLFIYLAWPGLSYRMWTLICGMWDLIPQSGIKLKPPPLESWSLATGPPRKSLLCPFLKAIAYTLSLSRIFLVSSTFQVCRSSNFQIFMTVCEFLFFHCNFDIQNLVQFSFFHPSFLFFSSPQTRLTVVFYPASYL